MPPIFWPLFCAAILIVMADNTIAAPAEWCDRTPGQGECV